MRGATPSPVALVLALALGGCVEASPAEPLPDAAPADTGVDPARDGAVVHRDPPSCEEALGRRVIRRLTATQLANSLEDLFDSRDVPRADVLVDPAIRGYDADANAAVIRDLTADQLMRFAETVAEWAIPDHLDAISACSDMGAACQVAFVRGLGLRMYRRPVDEAMLNTYVGMLIDGPDFETGARAVLAAMLQAPGFLYRLELGEVDPTDASRVRLDSFEVASALSFFLTNSAPDGELLDAARQGRLVTDDDLDREFDRLMALPRAEEALAHFGRQWLLVDDLEAQVKDPGVGSYTPAVRASMLREAGAFFAHVFESGGGVADLFRSPTSFVDGPLAEYYGVADVTGPVLQSFDVRSADRAVGALGLGSVLARHALADSSSPVQRGALVRRRFLCETLPPPPSTVNTTLPPRVGAETTRERNLQHRQDPACAGCHRLMDPVGFALEHYDGFGQHRAEENGVPIDATGEIVATPTGDVALDGAESLSRYLAQSPEVRACFAENLAYYAYGVEGCTWASVVDGLEANTPLSEILRRVVHARHFRYRAAD